jgi:hypothetical protein
MSLLGQISRQGLFGEPGTRLGLREVERGLKGEAGDVGYGRGHYGSKRRMIMMICLVRNDRGN